ncbi:MAG: CoA transferase [Acidimicrobiales bacterium]
MTAIGPSKIDTLSVLEIAGSVAGGYAAKLLADWGASVTTVSGVTGSDAEWTEGMRLYLNRSKHILSLGDDAELDPLVAAADIIIESSSPDPLTSVVARFESDPRRIEVQISPFGSTGPFSKYRSSDITDQAVSGHLYLNGDPGREPLRGPEHQVAYAAGTHAAIGAFAALRARGMTGRGQVVEVTHHEVMTALHQFTLLRYTHNGDILTRMGNRYAGPGRPVGVYRCGDGLISLIAPRGDQLETLVSIAGLDHLLQRPEVQGIYDLMHHPTLLDEHLIPWLEAQDLNETIDLLQAVRVPATSVSSMVDLLNDEHLDIRDFWATTDLGHRQVRAPGPVARVTVSGDPDAHPGTLGSQPGAPGSQPDEPTPNLAHGPLAGLRVIDLTRVWAGPYATRVLADLGADVIMIEAPWARGLATIDQTSVMATRYYPDNDPGERHWNRIGFSNKYNLNKRSLALDLTQPEGLPVLKELIATADVVIENFSPRVMPQFGLDESELHELNPSLLYVTMPGFGRSGPSRDHVAYGPVIDSQAGLSALMGYEGETARKAGVAWPDPVVGMHAACATIAALVDRAADGLGRTVEVAQIEATVAMAGHAIVDFQLTGQESPPTGNRHRDFAPHGVYPCHGQDRWLALAVVDETSWIGLCRTAGLDPAWEAWPLIHRQAAQDQIDNAISAWTEHRSQGELVAALQAAQVPATAVADAAQVMADPQHAHREFFFAIEHPEAGTHRWPKLAVHLSDTPASYRMPGPTLNQHGAEVLRQLVGLDDEAIKGLVASGVVADRPPS